MAATNFCQQFSDKLPGVFGGDIESLLQQYIQSSDPQVVTSINDKLREVEEFRLEFQEQVTKLIQEWFRSCGQVVTSTRITFDQDARVVYRGDMDFRGVSRSDYFPGLIRKVAGYLALDQFSDISHLEEVDQYLVLHQYNSMRCRSLKRVGQFMHFNASSIEIPELESVGRLLGDSQYLTSISAPKLREAEYINLPFTTDIDLPLLVNVTDGILVNGANRLHVPKLRSVANSFHSKTVNLSLPELMVVDGLLAASKATAFDAPKLQTALAIQLPECIHINLSSLVKAERIEADCCKSITIPNLKQCEYIHLEYPVEEASFEELEMVGEQLNIHAAPGTFRKVFPKLSRVGRPVGQSSIPTRDFQGITVFYAERNDIDKRNAYKMTEEIKQEIAEGRLTSSDGVRVDVYLGTN